ncbi:MAG TPA: protein translocase subunit SecD [Candidatus Omnitrophica bacterium]|nr:protein translocase subunit SecD [Candidatus Omnitrophota bacterium]
MYKKLFWKIGLIVLVVATSLWYSFPLDKRINLGLDLKGGMHLVLKVDTSELPADAKAGAPERALEVIRNRIDLFGVAEPSMHLQGDDQIVIQLPGLTDRQRALQLIGETALLEFKMVNNDPQLFKSALEGNVPEGYELRYIQNKDASKNEPILLEEDAVLTGDTLVSADVQFDQASFGEPYIGIAFNSEGGKIFSELTRKNVGRRLAIVLDDKVLSAPRINEHIPSGKGIISGRFTPDEAKDLAIKLKAGALPAPLYIEEERTVGSILGQDSIRKGIYATAAGAICVFIFMAGYYLFAGIIANIALALNILLITAGLSLLGATLTLPGIAGVVLTLGMAVDANVLINERIKEELRLGRPLRLAINNGYNKAFGAIFDSNITTLIAAFLLFQFGTGPIRGFAVTLSIGLLASMFTAIVVTRTIFEFLLMTKAIHRLPMFRLIKDTKFDFIGKRKIFFTLSLVMVVLGMGLFFYKGKKMYGIDFIGGQIQEYSFEPPVVIEDVRGSLKSLGLADAIIQQDKKDPKVILIRIAQDTSYMVEEKLRESFPDQKIDILRVEQVGPAVGNQLKQKAICAILFSLAGILVYIGFRFKHFDFAVAGIIAVLHDILITIGFLSFSGRVIDLLIVSALLTIAGYSINDTIIIYDRIRELMRVNRKVSLFDAVNLAINQTLTRTILTTALTLFVVVALFFFGGEILNNFAYTLLIGFISGIYSTIFIASPLILVFQRKRSK